MEKAPIYVFDDSDNLLVITTDYLEAPFEESLGEEGVTLEVLFPSHLDDAQYFIGGNQIAFKDLEGRFRLFTIREIDDEDGTAMEKRVFCLPAIDELEDFLIEDKRPVDKTALEVTTTALTGVRWQVGNIASLGLNSAIFYYLSVKQSLRKIVETWGGELVDRVVVSGSGIVGRYVDIVTRRGADTGKRFEIDKDINRIKRTVLFYPKTAMYGRGPGVEVGDGYGRKVTFEEVIWLKANGNPVDKPLGQKWVGDADALLLYGVKQSDGSRQHRFGQAEFDDEDPAIVLQKTWDYLQESKSPRVSYEMDVYTFYGITGYEHEQVVLGDTGVIIDNKIKPEMLLESRVIKFKYDIGNPMNGEITVGNFLDLNEYQKRIDKAIEKVEDNSGVWDKVDNPIVDTDFPDTIPPVPTDINVVGLFKTIKLNWTFIPHSYIASYEVYASQVALFTPDATNLVFRGKTGGLVFEAETNQQWYFRMRTVNTHGTPSAFSGEFVGNTVTINGSVDIAPLTITNELIAANVSADKINVGTLNGTNVNITNLNADNINAGKLKAQYVEIGSTTTFANGYDPFKIAIGSRNIWKDSHLKRVVAYPNTTLTRTEGDGAEGIETNIVKCLPISLATTYYGFYHATEDRAITFEAGEEYTLSFLARGNVSDFNYTYFRRNSGEGANTNVGNIPVSLSTTEWKRIRATKASEWGTTTGHVQVASRDMGTFLGEKWFEVSEVKLEKGNKATDFTLASEDVVEDTTDKINDVTTAYTTAIKNNTDSIMIEVGKEVSDAEGRTKSYTDTKVTATSDSFNIRFGTIEGTQDGHGDQLAEVYSYFKFQPTGLNIGKSDSPLNINISNSQMDFIDNGNTVAYVNGQKMYINTAEILQSIIVGNHKIEKYDSNITLIKWVGV